MKQKAKREINQESIMLVALCLIVLVVMFGATVAWFLISGTATISNAEIDMDDLAELDIRVLVSEDTATDEAIDDEGYVKLSKVGIDDEQQYSIDLNIVELENIEEDTVAPGSYGQVKFKISSGSDKVSGFKISLMPKSEMLSGVATTLTEEELNKLIRSHIKFYAKYELNDGGTKKVYKQPVLYSDECEYEASASGGSGSGETYLQDTFTIDDDGYVYKGYTGDISKGEEVYVNLYWYWPYEFTDIPECLNIDDSSSIFFSEFEKYDSILEASQRIEEYDWDDTYIGNFTSKYIMHFDVEAIRK